MNVTRLGGHDRFGRIKDQRWDGADVDRYMYGYDDAGNRVYWFNPVATAQSVPDSV